MPFDGIITYHITKELNDLLAGGRIRKIYQPEEDEIRLTINNNQLNYTLLISANPNNSRIHLTQNSKKNPSTPPNFCMTLRKHLTNAVILKVEQLNSDRVLAITVRSKNEFGEDCTKQLICEITGRNSNIILVQNDENEDKIIDSLRKIGLQKSRFRQVLPGFNYIAPPIEDKFSFLNYKEDEVYDRLINSPLTIEKFFLRNFVGLSPAIIREIAFRANLDSDTPLKILNNGEKKRLINAFTYFVQNIDSAKPTIYKKNAKLLDFYCNNLSNLKAEENQYNTVSSMLEDFYYLRDKLLYFRNRSSALRQQITTLRKKDAKKLQNLHQDLKRSQKNEKNKLYGDLITANIWQLERGMSEALLPDYTSDPIVEVKVPLKVNETPSQNAQRFYKKYSKNKRAQEQLSKQIDLTVKELEYIDSLLNALETCTEEEELNEIIYEFNQSDLVKKKRKTNNKKPKPSRPLHFMSSEGFHIYVGKNNYQNDYISTRLGDKEDCWLHVKDAPGSHVLIQADGKFITEQTVLEGGMLAAKYSKLKNSENIPVDYLEYKFLKKPKNSPPGKVIFTEHNTMFITPDENVLSQLKQLD